MNENIFKLIFRNQVFLPIDSLFYRLYSIEPIKIKFKDLMSMVLNNHFSKYFCTTSFCLPKLQVLIAYRIIFLNLEELQKYSDLGQKIQNMYMLLKNSNQFQK